MTRNPRANKDVPDIDLALIYRAMATHRRQILWCLSLALACGIVFSLFSDRSYHSRTSVKLIHDTYSSEGLKSMGVRLGINVGRLKNLDAYYALLFPELMRDSRLIGHALFTPVTTCQGEKLLFGEFLRRNHTPLQPSDRNLQRPSATLDSLLHEGRDYIRMRADHRKESVLVDVRSSDPIVSQQVCQSISDYLLEFIRDYRLSKQRSEVEHFRQVLKEHKAKMEAAERAYVAYCDSHWGQQSPSSQAQAAKLAAELQNARHLYEGVKVECQVSEYRLHDMTPGFIVLESPAVANRKTGIDRVFFCCTFVVLGLLFSIIYYIRRELWAQIIR